MIAQPHANPAEQTHTDVIFRLQADIDRALAPALPDLKSAPYTLLDFPDHSNIGDSAIYSGERAWLESRTAQRPALVEPASDTHEVDGTGAVVLHGGGNFGDIYPKHQRYREAILAVHPDRPIIQMPQSIHYDDPGEIERTAGAIRDHGALLFLTRDHESFRLASRHFACDVRMCPDMAFALGPIERRGAPTRDVLLLLRDDKERVDAPRPPLPEGWDIADWGADPPTLLPAALRSARMHALKTGNPLDLRRNARRVAYFDALADLRTQRGLKLLSTARFVITDRLHAHILCTLLGIPHAILDNYYGKIARFSEAFDTLWSGVTKAESFDDAISAAGDWLIAEGAVSGEDRRQARC